ncbi:probable aspartic proteinase GIP2 [Daucus carota subsp. sativus]|nr:PREDICTED: basic 7S globulin 2-like [Daucus carota subsp. sativus]
MDLGGQHTWFNCDDFDLPTYKSISCNTEKCRKYKGYDCMNCALLIPVPPRCTNNACAVTYSNPFAFQDINNSLAEDALFVESTNGLSVGLTYKSPDPFPFSCSDYLRNLASGTKGMIGLVNTTTSLPAQMAAQFNLPHKFALCLPSTSGPIHGHMFIGGGPYIFRPYSKNIAKKLITTKLISYPVDTDKIYTVTDPYDEYFVHLKSITIDQKLVPLNASLLSINEDGFGGTTFSTRFPFTSLQRTLYTVFVTAFTEAAASRKMKRVDGPFDVCFNATNIPKSKTGPAVPHIDIGFAGGKNEWRLYGANSMVSVNEEVLCLAFVDGGKFPRTSVVIGGHQLENYLIEFDLISSNVGISSSLLTRNTTCSQSRVL